MSSSPAPEQTSNQPPGASKLPKRACDCCRKRKVRCDSNNPCGPCKKASITCAFLQKPKKKGPKGLRSARVLHALRRIGDSASVSPISPLSPGHGHGRPGYADWSMAGIASNQASAGEVPANASIAQRGYGPQRSTATNLRGGSYPIQQLRIARQPMPTHSVRRSSHPQHALQQQPMWQHHSSGSMTIDSEGRSATLSPASPKTHHSQRTIQGDVLFPFVKLFFSHMFPIMPIIDPAKYLEPLLYSNIAAMPSHLYCFLCALCAATSVQLDESIQQPPLHPVRRSDDILAEECLRERALFDPIETDDTLGVMTSFFLFAYHGNHEKPAKAWHYLQESITSAEILNLDDEQSYAKLSKEEGMWRRRLYWLLFITERAYAVQRRKHARLHVSVALPAVSEDPQMLTGFVNLARLFSAVDDSFVSTWRGIKKKETSDEAWLVQTQNQFDATARAFCLKELGETQLLDISVTSQWMQVLLWQIRVSKGLIQSNSANANGLSYPVTLARNVVAITSGANKHALDSHGIGMEQKLSDIAGHLADALKCTAGDISRTFSEGKQHLQTLLQKLSNIRGKESRYLRPLLCRVEAHGLLSCGIDRPILMPPTGSPQNIIVRHLQVPHHTFAPVPSDWPVPGSREAHRTSSQGGDSHMPDASRPNQTLQHRGSTGQTERGGELDHVAQPWPASLTSRN